MSILFKLPSLQLNTISGGGFTNNILYNHSIQYVQIYIYVDICTYNLEWVSLTLRSSSLLLSYCLCHQQYIVPLMYIASTYEYN